MRSTESNEGDDSVLGRLLAIIEAFDSDDGAVRLTDLARRADLPKATVHRFLQQLCAHHLVERTDDGYQLGVRLFELGSRAPQQRDLHEALPILGDLRDATHETVHLAVLDEAHVVYVERLLGHHNPPLGSRVGTRVPAHCTGLGKALVAFGPQDVAEAMLRGPLRRVTPHTVVMPGPLSRELAKIRREGVAHEHEESVLGVVAVACPVMGPDGVAVAAISVSGRSHRFDPLRYAPAVRTAALAVSRHLDESRHHRAALPRAGSPSRARRRLTPELFSSGEGEAQSDHSSDPD